METFYKFLDKYNSVSALEAKLVEEEIWANYKVEKTVLVLDMSGFSLLVQRHGIIHYLGMIRRMQVATKPIVEKFRGEVVKYEADNLYAVFDSSLDAVNAAVSINIAIEAMNTITESTKDLFVSIGIASGEMILIKNRDFFGDCVNLASKLGEDIAERKEILITQAVFEEVKGKTSYEFINESFVVSGLTLKASKVVY